MRLLLFKSHVAAYTKKDGTFVAAHDDKRQRRRVDPKSTSSMADAIADHAQSMGFDVSRVSSSLSNSNYVNIRHFPNGEDKDPEDFKVRVSDHALPPKHRDMGLADIEISPAGHEHDDTHSTDWKYAIRELAKKTGKKMPSSIAASDKRDETLRAKSQKAAEEKLVELQNSRASKLRLLIDDDSVTLKRSGSKASGWLEKDGKRLGEKPSDELFGLDFSGENRKVPSDKREAIENAIRRLGGGVLAKSIRYLILSPGYPEA